MPMTHSRIAVLLICMSATISSASAGTLANIYNTESSFGSYANLGQPQVQGGGVNTQGYYQPAPRNPQPYQFHTYAPRRSVP
jgi:hypothetical protein